ncbi:MAG: PA14 domain-containing protein [Bacillota bacterium]|nr:PA14 domain-containing protein [Bacillota bacterium]
MFTNLKKLRKATCLVTILVFMTTMFLSPTITSAAGSTNLVTIKITDSSNQSIPIYNNTSGTYNYGLSTPVRLTSNAKAAISFSLTNPTFAKYKFVAASNLTNLPAFPSDSDMINLNLPAPNSYDAYKDDLGENGYVTTKHYFYNGKANQYLDRTVSFGSPVSNDGNVLVQAAKPAIDIYETQGLNSNSFLLDTANNNSVYFTSPKSGLNLSPSTNVNGTVYYMKNAGLKSMKLWGYFAPKRTGSYLLGSYSDDGAYGYIIVNGNNNVFVNDWRIAGPQFRATPFNSSGVQIAANTAVSTSTQYKGIYLEAGKYYPIYMEWYEGNPTQGAFVPQYIYNSAPNHLFKISSDSSDINTNVTKYAIPQSEFYSSKTTTPGSQSTAYFSNSSGVDFPTTDGIYYMATKFISSEGTTQGLYGPFIVDTTKPVLSNLSVISSDSKGTKYATAGDKLTISFTTSEPLSVDPQLTLDGYIPTMSWIKNGNNYSTTISISSTDTINSSGNKLNQGPINAVLDHYSDLSGNEGDQVTDSSLTYDSVSATADIICTPSVVKANDVETILVNYSKPVKASDTPKITIDQLGSADINQANMSIVPAYTDRTHWEYDYKVQKADGQKYIDGVASVKLSDVHDNYDNVFSHGSSSFTIDTTPPSLSISGPSVSTTNHGPVTYTVTYTGADSDIITLSNSDITLECHNSNPNDGVGDVSGTVAPVSGNGKVWTVTINNTRGEGTLDIKIADGTAHDAAGNIAVGATSSSFTVINPSISPSIGGSSDLKIWKSVQLTGSCTLHDIDSNLPITYTWGFKETGTGKGYFSSTTGNSVKFTGTVPGKVTVTLTVTGYDLAGNEVSSNPSSQEITISKGQADIN